MPNHIKNRVYLSGDQKSIESLIADFATHFERKPKTSYDGDLIYTTTDGSAGWLNEETNTFRRRNEEDVIGVPEGYELLHEEAWTRFPDFNKVVPMPEGLDCTSGSHGDMAYHALFGDNTERFQMFGRGEQLRKLLSLEEKERVAAIELGVQYAKNVAATGHKTWYSWSTENWGTKWNAYSCGKVEENVYEFETAWKAVPEIIEKISAAYPSIEIRYEWSDEDTGCNCGTGYAVGGEMTVNRLENKSKEAYDLAFKLRPGYAQYYELVDGEYKYKEEEDELIISN